MKSNSPLTQRQPSDNSTPSLSNPYSGVLKITTDGKKVTSKVGGLLPAAAGSPESHPATASETQRSAGRRGADGCSRRASSREGRKVTGQWRGTLTACTTQTPQTAELPPDRGSHATARSEPAKNEWVPSAPGAGFGAGCRAD